MALRASTSRPGRLLLNSGLVAGRGTSEQDPELFLQLMLDRAIDLYRQYAESEHPIVFDRGIPDLIAYAADFGLEDRAIRSACDRYRYYPTVLFAPAWAEIYTQDDERTMTFDATVTFGDALRRGYQDCGYDLVHMPKTSLAQRTAFVIDLVEHS